MAKTHNPGFRRRSFEVVTRRLEFIKDDVLVNRLLHFGYRLLLLAAGVYAAYAVSFRLLPSLNDRLPLFLAVLITWVLVAYVLMPTMLRLLQLTVRRELLPHNAYTPEGFIGDPINLCLVGTREQVIGAFAKAGWHQADERTLRSNLKYLKLILFGTPYASAPMSKLYVFGRWQDLAFQKEIAGKRFHRHHVRFWAVAGDTQGKFSEHFRYWRIQLSDRLLHLTGLKPAEEVSQPNDKRLWIGAAIRDDGLAIIRYNGQVTHSIDENTNAERDFIVEQLVTIAKAKSETVDGAVPARTITNRALGDEMRTDGKLRIVDVTKC